MCSFQNDYNLMIDDSSDSTILPGATALIPLNPQRMPGHILGTAFMSETSENVQLWTQMMDNLELSVRYLESAGSSDTLFVEWFQKLSFDTGVVNAAAEACGVAGEVFAAKYANEAALCYESDITEDIEFPRPEYELASISREQRRIIAEDTDEPTS